MNFAIRHMKPDEYARCEQILRGLPKWFGIEDAIVNYVRDIQSMQTWVAESEDGCDGEVVGFLTLNRHNEHSAEVHVMAVSQMRTTAGAVADGWSNMLKRSCVRSRCSFFRSKRWPHHRPMNTTRGPVLSMIAWVSGLLRRTSYGASRTRA